MRCGREGGVASAKDGGGRKGGEGGDARRLCRGKKGARTGCLKRAVGRKGCIFPTTYLVGGGGKRRRGRGLEQVGRDAEMRKKRAGLSILERNRGGGKRSG